MGLIRPMGLIGLMGLVGCSSDDYEEQSEAPLGTIIPEVASYVTWFEEADKANKADEANRAYEAYGTKGITRAWTVPTGYVAYENGVQPIGIAFTKDGVDPAVGEGESPKTMIGNFFYTGGKWRTSLEDIKATDYYLYGYIPYLPGIRYRITDLHPDDDDDSNNETNTMHDGYSTGAIMTLENVPTVMTNDLCVAIGAKDGTDKETVTGLRRGDFNYEAKAISGGVAGGNYVFLLFDHLYAALRVKMKVYADYAALRTIKLKSLQLSTQAGETTSKDHNTITIKLKANDGSASPIQDITYVQTGATIGSGDHKGIEFWKSETATGETLTTDFKDFTGHFMPSGITTMILTSVYDVYDTNGNLVRPDCKATNTMVLKDLLTEQTTTQRGKRYTVNMTIQPTYLHVLSEPDLDDPKVTISKVTE